MTKRGCCAGVALRVSPWPFGGRAERRLCPTQRDRQSNSLYDILRHRAGVARGATGMRRLEHQTLNDRAYGALKKGLMSGQFKPGEVLTIRHLAAEYGISATPVRE